MIAASPCRLCKCFFTYRSVGTGFWSFHLWEERISFLTNDLFVFYFSFETVTVLQLPELICDFSLLLPTVNQLCDSIETSSGLKPALFLLQGHQEFSMDFFNWRWRIKSHRTCTVTVLLRSVLYYNHWLYFKKYFKKYLKSKSNEDSNKEWQIHHLSTQHRLS